MKTEKELIKEIRRLLNVYKPQIKSTHLECGDENVYISAPIADKVSFIDLHICYTIQGLNPAISIWFERNLKTKKDDYISVFFKSGETGLENYIN